MRTFLLIWLAQVVSRLGVQLTVFGLGLWLYQTTGAATLYGLVALISTGLGALFAPLGGVAVDRWDRRRLLLCRQAGACACALSLFTLIALDALDVGPALLLLTASAALGVLEFPLLSALTSALVPPASLGRASGLLLLSLALGPMLAPALGALLLPSIGLAGLVLIDVATSLCAAAILLCVRIPGRAPRADARPPAPALQDLLFGIRYIRARPGLLALLLFAAVVYFNIGMVQVLIVPLMLGFADNRALGFVLSLGGAGMLAGSVAMVAWGAPRRVVPVLLGFVLLQGLLLLVGAARPAVPLTAAAAFGILLAFPLVAGSSQAIWQRQIPLEAQGRVFSFRAMVLQGTLPIAMALAGPLADHVFEPMLIPGGPLAATAGRVLGVGPGRGVALLFALLGLLTGLSVAAGALYRPLRDVERGE